jgi:gliding motility-associated-like protein
MIFIKRQLNQLIHINLLHISIGILVLSCTLFYPFQSKANHIMGGFISMQQVDKAEGKFLLSLTLYMDMQMVLPEEEIIYLKDSYILHVYSKKTNQHIEEIIVGQDNTDGEGTGKYEELIYENRACANMRKLTSRRYQFQRIYKLNLSKYQEEEGYYMVWGSCCRNTALVNTIKPELWGSIIPLEFPALYVNGQATQFSTPDYPLLNGDYICVNRPFTYTMSAKDADGDELKYYLANPYTGTRDEVSEHAPPYASIKWISGISVKNMIPGNPALQINEKTGQLSVKASILGLFVFGIVCEKYRNGVKIGSSYHEFQLPVVDCYYQTPPAPVISYQNNPAKEIPLCQGDTLTLTTQDSPDWAFQWQRNGDNIAGANTAQLSTNLIGDYTVVKSFKKQCSNDTVSQITSIKLTSLNLGVHIQTSTNTICEGSSLRLTATSSEALHYEWRSSQSNTVITRTPVLEVGVAGIYYVQGKKEGNPCPSKSDSIEIKTHPIPQLPPSFDKEICIGDTVGLTTTNRGEWRYEWLLGNQMMGQLSHITVKDTGTYRVRVKDAFCSNTSNPYHVNYKPECMPSTFQLYIPDAFTPNQDQHNDTWSIRNVETSPDCEVVVYNRWGEIIYHSTGYQNPWDGTYQGQRVATGTYAYSIYIPKLNHTYHGRVVVIY